MQAAPRFAIILMLCSLWSAGPAPVRAADSQPERWSTLTHSAFRHIAAPGGASSNVIVQDLSGFLWLGTQAGLMRWDGYTMRRYSADNQRSHALPDGYILSLHIDPRGRLWIGTSAGGLARYDAEHDNFVRYPAGPKGVSDTRVSALAGDGAGGVWIGTGALLDHMGADGVLQRAGSGAPTIAGADLPQGGIEALLRDRRGNLWIGTRHGLLRRNAGDSALLPVALPSATDTGAAAAISTLYQDSAGRVWAGTRSTGAFTIAEGASVAQPVREGGPTPSIEHERVLSIVEVAPDQVWLGTEGMGIMAIDPESGATRRIRHQPDVPDSLTDNEVDALFRERSGIIFAATTSALSQFDPHPKAMVTLRQSGAPLDGALSIPSMLMRADGRMWLGVSGGGVHMVDPLSGGTGYLAPGPVPSGSGLPSGRVLAMANGPFGEVYLGTQQGLYRTDANGDKPVRVKLAPRSADGAVWTLAFHNGALWIGGLDGLWQFAMEGGVPGKALRHDTNSLGDTRVTALLPLADGALWIGTRAGLARIDGASGKLERLPTSATRADTLPPGYVSSLLLDRQQRLWVAIFGGGVAVLEKTGVDGRRVFRRLGSAQGLPYMGVNALLEDRAGMIWASTDDGLARIDPATFAVAAFGAAQGVHILSYWTNSRSMTDQGELLFGGLTGMTVVRPERVAPWTYQAPLVVTEVSVNDRPLPEGRFNGTPGAVGHTAGVIEITPQARERGFALAFAALDYSAPEKNRYAYRLLGFDANWISADAGARRISYNNLPPGDYTLQLKGSNRDGAFSPMLEVPVRALPAWHQTIAVRMLFALLVAALLAALLAALVQGRTALLRRRQRELEKQIGERTAELQASQRQLEIFAYADPLTGLPNRRCFNDELRHMGARALREQHSFTLLLIDLDHFKQINDTLGHDAGDALLMEAARRLQLAVRESDRLARLGGDEFAVLLPQTGDAATAAVICDRIVASMAEAIMFGEQRMQISASVGAAASGEVGGDLDALYKAADVALYETKHRGRNGWSWYRAPGS
ncbi:diguanylate cyclase domain-containing protein [Massilia sp. TWP1-3-3]|uniref:diguanylate cyclase domain-containing protein n=1 Tax=Massilia sp. TWP1-3-3 TaxID=2804573 RepID=UPI003CF02F6B